MVMKATKALQKAMKMMKAPKAMKTMTAMKLLKAITPCVSNVAIFVLLLGATVATLGIVAIMFVTTSFALIEN